MYIFFGQIATFFYSLDAGVVILLGSGEGILDETVIENAGDNSQSGESKGDDSRILVNLEKEEKHVAAHGCDIFKSENQNKDGKDNRTGEVESFHRMIIK